MTVSNYDFDAMGETEYTLSDEFKCIAKRTSQIGLHFTG